MNTHLKVLAAISLGLTLDAAAISRDEVLVRARAFAAHPWRVGTSNLRGTCGASYRSVYEPGDYIGLPYDWGGYMDVFTFDQAILRGAGAGSYPADGVIACAVGLDCSGFVSQAWNTGHYGTSTLGTVSTQLANTGALLPGDVMNQAGYHVAMFSHKLANGGPVFIESVGYNVHVNATGGWSYVSGFLPRRFNSITGTTAGNPAGSPTNPIVIGSLPYTDTRDTKASLTDFFDGCNAAPTKNESGPEYVYKLDVTRPGQLTVSVTDDAGVDIDVHLFKSMNTSDCTSRHDSTFTAAVDCGTYYVVADTFGGAANAGRYTLNVSLASTTTTCGTNGPRPYNFTGAPGSACSYPGDDTLPFCNDNLGSETCIYTSGTRAISFCSHSCATNADCGDMAGSCCDEVGSGETYCMAASLCGSSGTPDAGTSTGGGLDAGFVDVDYDAGTPYVDAGTPYVDAGTPYVDAGTPYVDAGTPYVDAGAPYVDAGTPYVDAGSEPVETADAGTTTGPDNETPLPRKDPPTQKPEEGGWGCTSAGTTALALLFTARRRRRTAEA